MGVTTIVRIERNQVEPHARTIRKLAAGLEVKPQLLMGGVEYLDEPLQEEPSEKKPSEKTEREKRIGF